MAEFDASTTQAYLTFQFRGRVEGKDIRNRQEHWYASKHFNPAIPVLWDLRDCSPGESFLDITHSAQSVADRTESAHRTGRSAILVSSDLMESTVNAIMHATHWRPQSRLFRSLDEAIDWLTE